MAKNERNGRRRRSGANKKEFWGHVPTKDGRGDGMGLVGWGYKDGKVPTAQRASELKSASAEEGNRRRIKS